MLGAALTSLRDGAFSKKILNFSISCYALTVLYSTFSAPAGTQAYDVIPDFVERIGLPQVSSWIGSVVVDPATDMPDLVGLVAVVVLASGILLGTLVSESSRSLPTQPAHAIVLGISLLVDFNGWSLIGTSIASVLTLAISCALYLRSKNDEDWFGMAMLNGVGGPLLATLAAPAACVAFLCVQSGTSPTRVIVVDDPFRRGEPRASDS